MKKLKVFVDMDKEEMFLNEMAMKGYQLTRYPHMGSYVFEQKESKKLNYRVDYQMFTKKSNFDNYITLFEDAGWKHVFGSTYTGSQYFLPLDEGQTKDIYSDSESKAKRHNRLSKGYIKRMSLLPMYSLVLLMSVDYNLLNLFTFNKLVIDDQGVLLIGTLLTQILLLIIKISPLVMIILMLFVNGRRSYKAKMIYKKSIKNESRL